MKYINKCSKGGGCNNWATHVLVYINKTTFKEITDTVKPYCRYHAEYMQLTTRTVHDVRSRIYSADDWNRRLEEFKRRGGEIKYKKI